MNIINFFCERQVQADYKRDIGEAKCAFTTIITDEGIAILCNGICIKTVPMTMTYEDVEKILAEYRLCATSHIDKIYGKK